MSNRAWMPLSIDDYMADTLHLSAAEHGAYMLLIMRYWKDGGLPDDEHLIMRFSRLSPEQWAESRDVIAAFFDAGWKHSRIDAELTKADEIIEKRKAAASARHNRSKPAASELHVQSKSSDTGVPPMTNNQDQKEEPIGSSKKKRACRLPDDFAPDLDWAVEQGLSRQQATAEAARFRDYWIGQPGTKGTKLDWPATWRNWVRSAVERLPRGSPPGRQQQQRHDPFKSLAERLTNEPDRSRPSHDHHRDDAQGVPFLTIDHDRR